MAGPLGGSDDEISTINVTPLVDVVLVLLVIFMITAPSLYQNAIKIQLPQAKSAEEQAKTTLQVTMDQAGDITVQGKKISLDDLRALVLREHLSAAIVLADKKVEHGRVISLIDVLRGAGVQKFSFGVEKR